MAMIKHEDEADLQRRICEILNKHGYHFKKARANYFCDIVETNVNAYIEVKTNGKFAPHQLLYGLVRENVNDARYIILANEFEMRVYSCPEEDKMRAFALSVSPDLSRNPSSVVEMRYLDEAFRILGQHRVIYTYHGPFKIDEKQPCIFLDENNYEYFQIVLQKYRINPAEFVNNFASTWVKKSRLFIKNDNMTIFDQETGNEVKAHRQIKNEFDRMLIRSTRVKPENIKQIIHKMDTLAPIDVRRKRGKYWSNLEVSDIVAEVIRDVVDPTFVFEPFVGGGSLVRDFVGEIPGVVNDIDEHAVDLLEKEWEGYGWTFHKKNFLTTPINEALTSWGLPRSTERFLIYTNPPFGTSNTPELISKKGETKGSRKTAIRYGSDAEEKYFTDTYGRGDLCIPSIAHMVEIIVRRKSGYLAFFSPFGVLLGRNRFNKLLCSILKDFTFLYGEVFPGSMFNGVSKNKAISFTVWKYTPNVFTRQSDMKFVFGTKEIGLKILPLLKDGWNYDTRKLYEGEIAAQVNYSFGSMIPKVLHLQVNKGGSELIPKNVRIPLKISIPDELFYGLWSILVGRKSNIIDAPNYPVSFDNCYTHLPDLEHVATFEILAYTVLYTIIFEKENNYCQGKIGFTGMNRVFRFGGDRLTKGAMHLIETQGDCPVGKNETVKSVFDKLKSGKDPDEIDKKLRLYIREEVQRRLEVIGYWDYLPVPDIGSGGDNDDDDDDEKMTKLVPRRKAKTRTAPIDEPVDIT